jgi:hypothetical protein
VNGTSIFKVGESYENGHFSGFQSMPQTGIKIKAVCGMEHSDQQDPSLHFKEPCICKCEMLKNW